MKRLYATTAILLLSGGLALAQSQGMAPGMNPSNPQDLTRLCKNVHARERRRIVSSVVFS